MAFGKYLDDHPEKDNPLIAELQRQTTLYRIAITNVLQDRQPKEPKKSARKKSNTG